MKKFILLSFSVILVYSPLGQTSYPIPEFELVVVENLPGHLRLDMTLEEIERTKHKSRITHHKKLIYDLVTKKVSPLLNHGSFTDGFNMFQLIQSIPGQEILQELIREQKKISVDQHQDSDFLLLILPKLPAGLETSQQLPYASFYSRNKAPLIDSADVGFLADKSYDQLINNRLQQAVDFAYQRNQKMGGSQDAFFVGGLLAIQLRGAETTLSVQLVAGLPTDIEFPAPIKSPEATFDFFRLPKKPIKKQFSEDWTDYPGAVLTLNYNETNPQPLSLNVHFGSLSKVEKGHFVPALTPQPYDQLRVGWKDVAAVIFKRYNVPNLYGTEFAPVGKFVLNDWSRDIQVNIHEVDIDLQNLEISNMRITAEFPPKTIWGGWNIAHDFMPRIEQPGLNEQFKQEANNKISPYRKRLQQLKQNIYDRGLLGPLLDSTNQDELMGLILSTLNANDRSSK